MIDKYTPPTQAEIEFFVKEAEFTLPNGFIDFYKMTNGADITSKDSYTVLWPLTELFEINKGYKVDEYAPDFFIFGTDGGGIAYVIEKATGSIFEMPFIGMSPEEARFISTSFTEFIGNLKD